MAAEDTRRAPRRNGNTNTKGPPSVVERYLPYVLGGAVVLALLATVSGSDRYGLHAGAVLAAGVVLALGYVGWQHTITLPPGDSLRAPVTAVSGAVALACLAPLGLAFFNPHLVRTVTLSREGDRQEFDLGADARAVVVTSSVGLASTTEEALQGEYRFHVTREGTDADENLKGTLTVAESTLAGGASGRRARPNRHLLGALRGAGHYAVTLDHVPSAVRPPVTVRVYTEPVAEWMLAAVYALLALLVMWVDAALFRTGNEPAFAASLGVPLVASLLLHRLLNPAALVSSLLASLIVGFVVGGLGGELLGRAGRVVWGK
ncbi:MAG: hypothetical protein HY909_17625 [Deltaproteobacteria bacterium]|nr:hypothetical protein [Deltaproteobacteria bacterium]